MARSGVERRDRVDLDEHLKVMFMERLLDGADAAVEAATFDVLVAGAER